MDSWLQSSRLGLGTVGACRKAEFTVRSFKGEKQQRRLNGQSDELAVHSYLHELPLSGARLGVQHVERVYPVVRGSFGRGNQHERVHERNEEHIAAERQHNAT